MRSRSLSLSAPSLGWKSTSTPRSLENLHRGRRELVGDQELWGPWLKPSFCELPPVLLAKAQSSQASEPRCPRSRPSRRTRCAGPAAHRDRRRCRGDAFLLQRGRNALGEPRLRVGRQLRHADRDLQADRGVGASRRVLGEEARPKAFARPSRRSPWRWRRRGRSGLQSADRFRPVQRIELVLDAEHRRRVDRVALENALD